MEAAHQHPQLHPDNACVNHPSYYHREKEVSQVMFKLSLLYNCTKARERQASEGGDPAQGARS